MNAASIIDSVIDRLTRLFGKPRAADRARVLTFGTALTCSLNYSKLLRGSKYFFGLPSSVVDKDQIFQSTTFGDFVLLICGTPDNVLVLPRTFVVDMMRGVSSRRLDIFMDGQAYILQTTRHPKCDVSQYLNALPAALSTPPPEGAPPDAIERAHVKVQFALIALGRAEGCAVWVPINDRNLSYRREPFSSRTLSRLPNFGFDENTRRSFKTLMYCG